VNKVHLVELKNRDNIIDLVIAPPIDLRWCRIMLKPSRVLDVMPRTWSVGIRNSQTAAVIPWI